ATARINDQNAGNPVVTYNLADTRITQDSILRLDEQSASVVRAQINLNGTQGTLDDTGGTADDFDILGVTKSTGAVSSLNIGVVGSQFNAFLLGTSDGDVVLNIVNGDITAAANGSIGSAPNLVNTGGLATINGSVNIRSSGNNELFVGNGQLRVGQDLIVQGAGQVVNSQIVLPSGGTAIAVDPSISVGRTLAGGDDDGGAEILNVDISLDSGGTIDVFDGDDTPDPIGELDITGDLDLLGDTVFKLDLRGATTAGVDYDTVDLLGGGQLTIAPNSTLTVMVTNTSGGTYSPMLSDVFDLIDYNGPDPTQFETLIVTGIDGTNAMLQFAPNGILQLTGIIPEPAAPTLIFLAASLFLRRRRRR
ncbi:MAG: hypothetical protein AAF591_22325, partial [Verrucomicrobiota bacterium]